MTSNESVEPINLYKTAFPDWSRVLILVLVIVLLLMTLSLQIWLLSSTASTSSDLSDLGRWLVGLLVTPFIALMTAYVWMLLRLDWWHKSRFIPRLTDISWPFAFSGTSLVMGIVSMVLHGLEMGDYWDEIGVAFAVASLLLHVLCALIVVRAWEIERRSDRHRVRRGSDAAIRRSKSAGGYTSATPASRTHTAGHHGAHSSQPSESREL